MAEYKNVEIPFLEKPEELGWQVLLAQNKNKLM